MEKIGICRCNGKPIIGRVEYEEAVLKANEIVEEINKQAEEIKHLWTNLIDLQKEMLKIPKLLELDKKARKRKKERGG